MGCGRSVAVSVPEKPRESMSKSEAALKAALLIQNWYRRYVARLEARRRAAWNIYQTIEYSGEQDQLKLYNFFNDMIDHISMSEPGKDKFSNLVSPTSGRFKANGSPAASRSSSPLIFAKQIQAQPSIEEEDLEFLTATDPSKLRVLATYKGPTIKFPLTQGAVETMMYHFKRKQYMHAKYALEILRETRNVLKRQATINHASTSISRQITICGDLHGKLDDLLIIFYKNGLPSVDNPYIFNGDFVDRGDNSTEVALMLFVCLILNPNSLYINRGNHEDHIMNLRYGFIKELMHKYKEHASKVVRGFEEVFSWLPLGTVIDHKVLVVHGGISDQTDLKYLEKIDRHKYLSALRPPRTMDANGGSRLSVNGVDGDDDSNIEVDHINLREWKQILDVLWSDPRPIPGCSPNTFRGGGSYFGPDVTDMLLSKNNLQLIIRSHECKHEGYEYCHDNKVLTIFSASNYYELGSNKGAYIKLSSDMKPHFVQYMASNSHKKLGLKQRLSLVEESALRDVKEKLYSHQSTLMEEFKKCDPANTGLISPTDWSKSVDAVMELDLPWRTLRSKLVRTTAQGLVDYKSSFEEFTLHQFSKTCGPSVTEVLYRNKNSLETIFRIMDKDNSGSISMEEFEESCRLLSAHIKTPISPQYIKDLAKSIDMNKDGCIDFNEFLEAFRLVDRDHRASQNAASEKKARDTNSEKVNTRRNELENDDADAVETTNRGNANSTGKLENEATETGDAEICENANVNRELETVETVVEADVTLQMHQKPISAS